MPVSDSDGLFSGGHYLRIVQEGAMPNGPTWCVHSKDRAIWSGVFKQSWHKTNQFRGDCLARNLFVRSLVSFKIPGSEMMTGLLNTMIIKNWESAHCKYIDFIFNLFYQLSVHQPEAFTSKVSVPLAFALWGGKKAMKNSLHCRGLATQRLPSTLPTLPETMQIHCTKQGNCVILRYSGHVAG